MTLFAQLTGHDQAHWLDTTDTASPGRLVIVMLAPVITAYEHAMTDGEGRNTWRTDRYSPCPRADAGTYLAFLASLGYQLSAIEQAVADGTPYTGDTTLAGLLAPEQPEAGAEPGGDIGNADPAVAATLAHRRKPPDRNVCVGPSAARRRSCAASTPGSIAAARQLPASHARTVGLANTDGFRSAVIRTYIRTRGTP